MFIKDLLTKKHSFALSDLQYVIIPSAIFYLLHVLNNITRVIDKDFQSLSKDIQILKQENNTLKELVAKLSQDNGIMKELIQEKNNVILEQSTQSTSNLLSNEMVQFYVKTAGVVAAGIVVLYVLNTTTSLGLFSAKKLLPTKAYTLIQDYTPFFQERKTYFHRDELSKTDWSINILNDRSVNMLVKPDQSDDFIPISDFLSSLHRNAGTMVPYNGNITSTDVLSTTTHNLPTSTDVLSTTIQHSYTVAEATNLIANALL